MITFLALHGPRKVAGNLCGVGLGLGLGQRTLVYLLGPSKDITGTGQYERFLKVISLFRFFKECLPMNINPSQLLHKIIIFYWARQLNILVINGIV